MRSDRPIIALNALAALLAANAAVAQTQAYPSRPVRLVVAFAPGGGTDIVARIIGQKLAQIWPQPVIIDNRPGAGSTIGTEIVAKSPPDGYTLQAVSMSHALNAALFRKLPYDTLKDFAPIVLAARAPNVLVAHPALPVKNVRELIALAKAQPGKIAYSSSGTGGVSHLTVELFRSVAHIDLLHVPYKGAGPAMTALLSGEAQLMMATTPVALGQMKAKRVRALAISSLKRSILAPDIPTIAESGFPRFEADTWYGVIAPARIPAALSAKISADINQSLKGGDVRAQLAEQGAEVAGGTPEQFGAFIESELARWTRVIRAAHIEAN
jgi:tripartite-type tricarboxylate transporter receptor subunit TctC